jgi:hypothetical protein
MAGRCNWSDHPIGRIDRHLFGGSVEVARDRSFRTWAGRRNLRVIACVLHVGREHSLSSTSGPTLRPRSHGRPARIHLHEEMGGQLEDEPKPMGGTTFSVEIPLADTVSDADSLFAP